MDCLFYNCSSLQSLAKISIWKLNNVKIANDMFEGCNKKLKRPKFKFKKK